MKQILARIVVEDGALVECPWQNWMKENREGMVCRSVEKKWQALQALLWFGVPEFLGTFKPGRRFHCTKFARTFVVLRFLEHSSLAGFIVSELRDHSAPRLLE
jgi:hypothetical protein